MRALTAMLFYRISNKWYKSLMPKPNLYDLTLEEITRRLAEYGEAAYRARQIFEWLYEKDVSDVGRMTNLSAAVRAKLAAEWSTEIPVVEKIVEAEDGTEKFLLRLASSDKKTGEPHRIESVLMPADDRMTLCISSQVGCALDCIFCATATMGFKHNLAPSEIVGQVILAKRRLVEKGKRLSNIVFMGMGEPLLNFDSVCTALSNLTGKESMGMSPSRITVSTAGVADRLKELGERFAVNIAISLNAPNPKLREDIMPRVAGKHDLDSLLVAAKEIGKTRRKPVTFEYVLLAGVTDGAAEAKELIRLISSIRCKVNLIPFNPFPGSKFKRPDPQQVLAFQKILWDSGVQAYIRWSQGLDVNAACGQLAVGGK